MMKISKSLVGVSLALLNLSLSACSSAPIPLEPSDLSGDIGDSTVLAFAYEINQNGCMLRLSNLADDHEYDLILDPRSNVAVFEVPDGAYRGIQLGCSRLKSWSLNRFLKKEVELSRGKINYLGSVSFIFDGTGQELKLKFGERAKDMEGASQVIEQLPAALRKSVVNAYTTKPIGLAMTNTAAPWSPELKLKIQRIVKTTAGESSESKSDAVVGQLRADLTACSQDEQKRYPLQIGRQKWVAKYEDGKLQKIIRERNEHSFSDDWTHCIEEAFGRMNSPGNEKIEVTLEL